MKRRKNDQNGGDRSSPSTSDRVLRSHTRHLISTNNDSSSLPPASDRVSPIKRTKLFSDRNPNSLKCNHESVSALGVGSSVSAVDGDGDKSTSFDSSSNDGESEGPNDSNDKVEELEVGLVLPDDLLHHVLSYLDITDFGRAATVCRQWRAVSASEEFWRSLNFSHRKIGVRQFEGICRRHPKSTSVNVFGTSCMSSLAMKALKSLRFLETLVVGGNHLSQAFFLGLKDRASLKNLSISDTGFSGGFNTDIPNLALNHEELQSLQITKCRWSRLSISCPKLEILSLKRSTISNLSLDCPRLHELAIGSCGQLSNAEICSAACSCPLLTTLDISDILSLTREHLSQIIQTCVQLRTLIASHCPNISFESIRLPLLTVLKLDNCEGIDPASMFEISRSYMLQVLELGNCVQLTSISLNLHHLQSIRVTHCYRLRKLNLQTPVLSSITVSDCCSLHCIRVTSNSLKRLVLRHQLSLATLALNCPALEEVDLTDCRSLMHFLPDVFSDGGNCPTLRSLVLDSCQNLNTVRLHNTALVSLSLVGCCTMTALELTCPSLEQIYLNGCGNLETALFCPVDLQSLNLGICPKLNLLQIEAPQMTALELKGCGALSKASVQCPRLMSLDASFCSQLTDDCLCATTTSCPLIGSLILMSCSSIGPHGLTSLHCLEHLTLLDLSYTYLMDLQPIFGYCLKLQVLKLQACKYLTDSSLKPLYSEGALPALHELDLSYVSLCHSAIEELLVRCTRLTDVNLNGCTNMHDLNWDTSGTPHSESSSSELILEDSLELIEQPKHSLQNLSCIGCMHVGKVVIPAVANFCHLSSLNLSLSVNLKEVDIACSNLVMLNLSNCSSLENIKLDCPRLTRLYLQFSSIGEEALEAAISLCRKLGTLDVRQCPMIHQVSIGRIRAVCPSLKRVIS